MSETVIKTEKLTKCFGNFTAVGQLDLDIKAGVLFGFIGPNGAGKTTTIRMLCGLLRPTSGHASVAGIDVVRHPREAKRVIGYLPEFFGTYDRMRVWEYLDFFGAAYRIPRRKRREHIEKVLDLTGTDYMRDFFIGTLSKGMRQRVGLAKTLVHDPPILFLDEPMSGLDPVARIEIRELLRKFKTLGKTTLISSHILPDLTSICDEVGIIDKSQLLAIGPIKKILAEIRQARQVLIHFVSRAQEAANWMKKVDEISHIKVVENLVQFEFQGDDVRAAELLGLLHKRGFSISWMTEVEADLEEAFISVTGRAAGASVSSE